MKNLQYIALGILTGYLGCYIYQLTNTIQTRYFPTSPKSRNTSVEDDDEDDNK